MPQPTQTPVPERTPRRGAGRWLRELWVQVLVAAVLGIAVGILFPGVGAELAPLSDWFVALVKMIVAPVIFCVVTTAVGNVDSLRRVGRIGVKALGYFVVLSLASMLIGLVVANVFTPGAGLHIDPHSLHGGGDVPDAGQAKEATSLTGFVSGIIPDTLLSAFTGGDILPALFVAILFGFALRASGEQGAGIVRAVGNLSGVVFRIVGWIMRTAPIGTFGALAAVVATYGAETLRQLGYLVLVFFATCVLYIALLLWGIARGLGGIGLLPLMRYLKDELLIALSTCSSEAVLPQVIRKLEALGVGRPVVGITVPAGFSFNLDGSAIYLTMTSLFLAQAVGVDLSWQQQVVMVGIMMFMSKGTAGVAGGAFVILTSSVSALGHVPLAALALVVGVDRILNEGRVFINVLGNALATVVVGRWEKDFDLDRARRVLSGETVPAAPVPAPAPAAVPAADGGGAGGAPEPGTVRK